MIATPAAASWRTTLNSVSHSDVDSAEVGSSIIRMRASSDSALAISTSCCSPTRRSATRLCGSMAIPSLLRSPSAARAIRRRSTIVPAISGSRPRKMLSAAREFRNEIELLMNDRDSGPLGVLHAGEPDLRAREPDDAVVVDMHAGEDFHQRRLAGAVLSDKRMHFARPQIEVDVDQRRNSAERFGHARGFEDGAARLRATSRSRPHSTGRSIRPRRFLHHAWERRPPAWS